MSSIAADLGTGRRAREASRTQMQAASLKLCSPMRSRTLGRLLLALLLSGVPPAANALALRHDAASYRRYSHTCSRSSWLRSSLDESMPVSKQETVAMRWRIAQLRSEIEASRREVRALRAQLGDRAQPTVQLTAFWRRAFAGLQTFAVGAETARRSLALSLESEEGDPLGSLLGESQAMMRLASNITELYESSQLIELSPSLFARATQLEPRVPGLTRALEEHADVLAPEFEAILARLGQLEPHLPVLVERLDLLAPHASPLLRHADTLLEYAELDGAQLQTLLPYLDDFAPRLDAIAPHLLLLRPHLPLLVPYLPVLAPAAHRVLPHVALSANADLLLHYFGWTLRLPLLRRALFLPGVPRAIAILSRWLPTRRVRGPRDQWACDWEGCGVSYEANAERYYSAPASSAAVMKAVADAQRG